MSVSNINIPTAQSFILVDTRTGPNKVLFLPTASTIQGRYLSIKDYYGNATKSTLTISTTGLDRIDQRGINYTLCSSFGSVMLLSDGLRSWNMMGLYEGADTALSTMAVTVVTSTTSVRLINLGSASGGTTSGSFTVNSSAGGGTGTFTNSDVFASSATWGMAQCFDGARSDYDLYMTQNPNFMQIVFPRALTVTKIFLVPRNQGDAFPSSLTLKADGTLLGTYSSSTVSQSLGMGISYSGTGYYIQPSVSGTTWRFDFSSTPVSFGEIEFWGYSS